MVCSRSAGAGGNDGGEALNGTTVINPMVAISSSSSSSSSRANDSYLYKKLRAANLSPALALLTNLLSPTTPEVDGAQGGAQGGDESAGTQGGEQGEGEGGGAPPPIDLPDALRAPGFIHALVNLMDDRSAVAAASPILRAVLLGERSAIAERAATRAELGGAAAAEAEETTSDLLPTSPTSPSSKSRVPPVLRLVVDGWVDCYCEQVRSSCLFFVRLFVLFSLGCFVCSNPSPPTATHTNPVNAARSVAFLSSRTARSRTHRCTNSPPLCASSSMRCRPEAASMLSTSCAA